MLLRHAALRTTLDRNGIVPADSSVDLGGFPRLSPAAYQYVTLSLAGLATAISLYRTYLRLSRFRRLDLDDFLLLFATATVIGAAVYGVTLKDLIYQQVYVSLGAEPITVAILDNIPSYARSLDVAGGAQWFSIYGTKVCYLLFFRKLGDRVRGLRAWRWGVTTLVIVSGLLSVFLVIYVCPASSAEEIYDFCLAGEYTREAVLLRITVALDITTDLLVMSIPIILISKVRIHLARKLVLLCILCLSTVMVLIAVIRIAFAELPGGITDTVWLLFWTSVEGAVAIIMVSVTAIRSLFGQDQRNNSRPRPGSPPAYSGTSGKANSTLASIASHLIPGQERSASIPIHLSVHSRNESYSRILSLPPTRDLPAAADLALSDLAPPPPPPTPTPAVSCACASRHLSSSTHPTARERSVSDGPSPAGAQARPRALVRCSCPPPQQPAPAVPAAVHARGPSGGTESAKERQRREEMEIRAARWGRTGRFVDGEPGEGGNGVGGNGGERPATSPP